ncbi:TlpA family protein disulfide reductase [Gemmatimonadota bacterium]
MFLRIPARTTAVRLSVIPVLLLVSLLVVSCSKNTWRSGALELVEGYNEAGGYYSPSRSPLLDEPVETLVAEPDYQGTPRYGSYTIGEGEDNILSYVLDHQEGTASLFYLDLNNNEDLTDDGDGGWDNVSDNTNMVTRTVQVSFADGDVLPMQFFFYFFNTRPLDVQMQQGVLYARSNSRLGEITLAGETYRIGIAENNNNGIFDMRDAETDTILPGIIGVVIDFNQDGVLLPGGDSPEHSRLGEAFNVGGKSYEIADVSPKGEWIEFRLSDEEVEPKPYIEVGYAAPAFAQEDCEGNMIELEEYVKDYEVLLLDFWATWCGPCLEELPNVLAVFEEYRDQGFGVLGISLDLAPDPDDPQDGQMTAEQVRAFMDERGMDWPTTYDGLYWSNAVADIYRVNGIPATFLLDSEGIIRYKNVRGEALGEAVRAMLEGEGDH